MSRINYRIGHCAQCDGQIMVRDVDGRWNALKRNYRNAIIIFNNGHKMTVPVCASCEDALDCDII